MVIYSEYLCAGIYTVREVTQNAATDDAYSRQANVMLTSMS